MKCLRDLLFPNGASVTAHSAEDLQKLMNRFSKACQGFGLTISLRKTQVMAQDMDSPPNIAILGHEQKVVWLRTPWLNDLSLSLSNIFNKYDNSFPQPFEIYVKKKFIVTDKMGNIFGLFFPLDVTMVTALPSRGGMSSYSALWFKAIIHV